VAALRVSRGEAETGESESEQGLFFTGRKRIAAQPVAQ